MRRLVRRRRPTADQKASTVNSSLEDMKMANPAPGFVSRPDYRVDLVPESRHVKIVFGGVTIADSSAALRCAETGHGPVHYLPEKDLRIDLLSPTAAEIGAEVLAEGGTAVDAVVATAVALAAAEPWNSGLGGIGFMVVHPAGAGRAEIVDFGPISPGGLDPAAFPLTGGMRTELFTWPQVVDDRNIHGPLSFAVPSAVRGYALALERFGRVPWRELVAPAIALARSGLPIDWFTTI